MELLLKSVLTRDGHWMELKILASSIYHEKLFYETFF